MMQVWKGYSQRRKTKKMREEELIFVGMVSDVIFPVTYIRNSLDQD